MCGAVISCCTDIILIHPMGWDAFGLPAENYAIKTGRASGHFHSRKIFRNIKRQINEIAAIYDWDREVNTTDPEVLQMDPVDLCEDVQRGPGL